MIDVLYLEKQFILATTALMPSAMAVMNLATLYRTALTRFLPSECHVPKIDLLQGISLPTPEGTDHTPSIMVPGIGDISAGHSPPPFPLLQKQQI